MPWHFWSKLNYAMEMELRENGIEVPFPQRDLHPHSGTFVVQAAPTPPAGHADPPAPGA